MKHPWDSELELAIRRQLRDAHSKQHRHAVLIPPLRWTPSGLRRVEMRAPELPRVKPTGKLRRRAALFVIVGFLALWTGLATGVLLDAIQRERSNQQ